MTFPAMNAKTVSSVWFPGTATSGTIAFALATGPMNAFSVPAVVDVSGMEFSICMVADSITGASLLEAQTGSTLGLAFSDGGPTGDNTTVTVLFSALTNTVAFDDTVPRDVSGSSTTDLDADDWVNFHITAQTTTVAKAGVVRGVVSYLYGKPAAIN
jgi:hypothetical protein